MCFLTLFLQTSKHLLPAGLREAQAAGNKFTLRLRQQRHVAPIHVKLGMKDGRAGPLGCA